MGLSPFKSCSTRFSSFLAPAPNPQPNRWELLEIFQADRGYVLKVRYLDCTNFEGVKVMVYRGRYAPRRSLDPHFYDSPDAPLARFRPGAEGWRVACAYAQSL